MSKACDGARQQDVKTLKKTIRTYIAFDLKPDEIAVMGNIMNKDQRGFNNRITAEYLIVTVWSRDITISFVNEFTNSLLPRISHLVILCGSSPSFRSFRLNGQRRNSGVPCRPLLYWPRLCLHCADSLLHADLYTVYIMQTLGVLLFLLTGYSFH